jgi:hypothetical protein
MNEIGEWDKRRTYRKTKQQTTLANAAVSDQQEFVQEIILLALCGRFISNIERGARFCEARDSYSKAHEKQKTHILRNTHDLLSQRWTSNHASSNVCFNCYLLMKVCIPGAELPQPISKLDKREKRGLLLLQV